MLRNYGTGFWIGTFIFIFSATCLYACAGKPEPAGAPAFSYPPQYQCVHPLSILEASGIADSKANPGCIWVVEDSGNLPFIYLLKHDGRVIKPVWMNWSQNRDWEDISLSASPEPGKSYLYIADIGDNARKHSEYYIMRLEEPPVSSDTVYKIDHITFNYPDGRHDSEAMLVDPVTKDIFIITKKEPRSIIYKLSYPYSNTQMNVVEKAGELPYNYVVSAAISPSGRDIVVKTYGDIYYYPHKAGESIVQSLQRNPVRLPYQMEPQGEAITFAADNSGFFTLSEKGLALSMKLYFYKRM